MPVYTPLPDTAEELMRKSASPPSRRGDGSPDVVWLLEEGTGEAHVYEAGDQLPSVSRSSPGRSPTTWCSGSRAIGAVVAGDTLVDFGKGLQINPRWLRRGMTRERVVEGLRPLLELPVEHVLPAHGAPTDRAALERALA